MYPVAMFRAILALGAEILGSSIQTKPMPPLIWQRKMVLIGTLLNNQNIIIKFLPSQSKNLFNQIS